MRRDRGEAVAVTARIGPRGNGNCSGRQPDQSDPCGDPFEGPSAGRPRYRAANPRCERRHRTRDRRCLCATSWSGRRIEEWIVAYDECTNPLLDKAPPRPTRPRCRRRWVAHGPQDELLPGRGRWWAGHGPKDDLPPGRRRWWAAPNATCPYTYGRRLGAGSRSRPDPRTARRDFDSVAVIGGRALRSRQRA